MAHYDCKNCGYSGGIAFGICSSCTPPEYFKLERELRCVSFSMEAKYETMIRPLLELIQQGSREIVNKNPEVIELRKKLSEIRSKNTSY